MMATIGGVVFGPRVDLKLRCRDVAGLSMYTNLPLSDLEAATTIRTVGAFKKSLTGCLQYQGKISPKNPKYFHGGRGRRIDSTVAPKLMAWYKIYKMGVA